jgi:putative hydrolase of the HAD superfamily
MKSIDKINAIFFDLGNTLIYFNGEFEDVLAEAEQALIDSLFMGMPGINKVEFLELFHSKLLKYYEQRQIDLIEYTTFAVFQNTLSEMGIGNLNPSLLRNALDEFYRITQSYWVVEEDAIQTLSKIKKMGFLLGAISNAGDDWDVQTLVDKAQIRSYVNVILSSAAFGIRKPDKRIFKHVMSILRVKPENVLMIGDTLDADIRGANDSGIYSVWLTRRADPKLNINYQDTILPDASISTLSELPFLINQIIKA